eukprot:206450_1
MSTKQSKVKPNAKIAPQLEITSNVICCGFCRPLAITLFNDIISMIQSFYILSYGNEIAFDLDYCYGYAVKSDNYLIRGVGMQWWWNNVCGATQFNNNSCVKISAKIKLENCPIYKFAVGIINVKQIHQLETMQVDSYYNPPNDVKVPHGGMFVGQFPQSYGLKFDDTKGNLYHNGNCITYKFITCSKKLANTYRYCPDHTIMMEVDLQMHTLSYHFDGVHYGKAFNIEKDGKYRFMLSMQGGFKDQTKDEIRIVLSHR